MRKTSGQSTKPTAQLELRQTGEGVSASPEKPNGGKSSLASRPMVDAQKDAVLAEILGDVALINEQVKEMAQQVQAVCEVMSVNDFVRWRNALDLKFTEIQEVNFSEDAARRLKGVVDAYLGQMAVQLNMLARIEVKKAVGETLAFQTLFDRLHREWLFRLGGICGAVTLGTMLGNFLWGLL
jgi:hypothetical protein